MVQLKKEASRVTRFLMNFQNWEEEKLQQTVEKHMWTVTLLFTVLTSKTRFGCSSLKQTQIRHLSISPAQSDTIGSDRPQPQKQPAVEEAQTTTRQQHFYCSKLNKNDGSETKSRTKTRTISVSFLNVNGSPCQCVFRLNKVTHCSCKKDIQTTSILVLSVSKPLSFTSLISCKKITQTSSFSFQHSH